MVALQLTSSATPYANSDLLLLVSKLALHLDFLHGLLTSPKPLNSLEKRTRITFLSARQTLYHRLFRRIYTQISTPFRRVKIPMFPRGNVIFSTRMRQDNVP
jgi:hypothetical protein